MQLSHIIYLITAGLALSSIYITYYGFFLTAIKSTKSSGVNLSDKTNPSWFDQKGQVIMLVIDALRFDYLTYNESDVGHEKFFYQNKFQNLHRIITENPENSVIFRAYSDPPTWTWEKIPGFVTGNIPPKAGMFQTTTASRLDEDTVLRELKLAKRNTTKAYHAGDPLWMDYFPDDLISLTHIEGMNWKDKNVDEGTMGQIKDVVLNKEFDLIVGHLLSVDHAGHGFGLFNPAVGENIAIVDKMIAELIEMMNDNTTLIIVGDHGMTTDGSHGQSSPEETNTAIAAFHKKGFQKYKEKGLSKLMRSISETELQVKQQDVAATLAMLLGIPIPYSNMGQILNDLYPAGDYLKDQLCEGAGFLTKMLNENHLNTLQILQYYKDFQQSTHQFSEAQHEKLVNLADEALKLYKEPQDMIQKSQQCQDSFKDKVTSAIVKSQEFSQKVYKQMLTSGSSDLSVVLQAMATTIILVLTYVLFIQYQYRHGYDKENDKIENLLQALKALIVPALASIVLMITMWLLDIRPVRIVASLTLFAALYLTGRLLVFLFKNSMQKLLSPSTNDELPLIAHSRKSDEGEKESAIETLDREQSVTALSVQSQPETCIIEKNSVLKNLSTLFLFRTPLYSLLALVLIVGLMYSIHLSVFEDTNFYYLLPYGPLMAMVMIVGRVCRNLPKKAYYAAIIASIVLCKILAMNGVEFRDSMMLKNILALVLFFDWIWAETKYVTTELKATNAWRILQMSCFLVLAIYHILYVKDKNSYWVEILLPRVVWGLLFFACLLKNIFKIEGLATKRNIQVCLIQLLFLLQDDKQAFPFAFVLSWMRISLHLFKKAKPANYLYPFVIIFWSYFGLFTMEHSDRWIPMDFKVGFIGLHEFNSIISSLMVFMGITSSFILGLLFISYHNQSVSQKNVETTIFASSGKVKKPILIINPRVIKRINIIAFVMVVHIVYFGAAIKCLAWMDFFMWEARQKFLMDSLFYMFIMGWASFALLLF